MKPLGLHVRWPLIAAAAVTGLAAYGAYVYKPVPVVPISRAGSATPKAHAARKAAKDKPTKQGQMSQASYERAISANLFNGPAPPEPKPAAPTVKPPLPIVVPPIPPDPLADAIYAGSATVDGRTTALIENRATHQGEYVFAGGNWQSHKIIDIAADHVTLSVNGVTRTLMASDTVNVVPLSASAAGTVPANGKAAGQPQAPSASAPQADAKAAQLQMFMKWKSSMDAAGKVLQMRGMELQMKGAQDKAQMLTITK